MTILLIPGLLCLFFVVRYARTSRPPIHDGGGPRRRGPY